MKSIITRLFLTVICIVLVFSVNVSATAKTFKFLAIPDPTANGGPNGEYWAKDATTTVEANENNGVTLQNTVDSRVLWAFFNTQVEETPYFCFDIPEGSGIFKVTLSQHWDVEPEIELDFKVGTNVFNAKEILKDQTTLGYTYFTFYFSANTPGVINNLYLCSEDPTVTPGDGNADTGDCLALTIVAAAVSAFVVFGKRR